MRNVRGGQRGCPGGLVEGRPRRCDVRRAAELVPRIALASRLRRAAGGLQSVYRNGEYKKRNAHGRRAAGGTAIRRLRRPSRCRFRPRRAGEQGAHCRPPHPRLASLCSAPDRPLLTAQVAATTGAQGLHSNSKPRQNSEARRRLIYSRGLSATGSRLSEATIQVLPPFCKLLSRPSRSRPPKYRGAWTEVIGQISDMANSAIA